MLLSLLPFLALGATSFAHPVLEARATAGCNADNVLRHLRGSNCLDDSLVFCSAYLGLPAITKTVAPLPTASVTVTEFQTVMTTETLIVTQTDVDFNKIKKRCTDSTTSTSSTISTPLCLKTTSIDPSRLSSACGCLTIPPGTVTVTAGEPQITSVHVTETDTVTSIIVSTTTKTITASSLILATPTSACGCNTDGGRGVAVGDIDDNYYRLLLDFDIEVYGVTSNVVLSSINGLIWFDDTIIGADYEEYFNDADDNGAELPLKSQYLPDVAVLPFWADLFINGGEVQGIWYEVVGTAGSRTITLEYIVSAYGDTANDYHFTVTFGEAGSVSANKVVIAYYSVLDGTAGTVAVQHYSDSKAIVQYRNGNGTPVSAGSTYTFDTIAGTVSAT